MKNREILITMLMMSNASVNSLQATVGQLNRSIGLLTQEVASLRQQRFGRSSEKGLVSESDYEQLCLAFNEAEVSLDLHPDREEPEMERVLPICSATVLRPRPL